MVDAAKHLGIAKDTVYRWIESNSLPAHHVGRLWKFKLSQVDAWIEAGGADQDSHQSDLRAHVVDSDDREHR